MGTCRMALQTDPHAVVDDNLRVHGMQNLRVIDASIMPTMLSANLNAGVLMIAEKGADMVLVQVLRRRLKQIGTIYNLLKVKWCGEKLLYFCKFKRTHFVSLTI